MTKEEARKYAGKIWSGLSSSRRGRLAEKAEILLISGRFQRIFLTVPFHGELDLLSATERTGIPMYLPAAAPGGRMTFHFYSSGPDRGRLSPGLFGIPVPPPGIPAVPGEGDLCLIPSLACNSGRFRLGRGGGYFDRFFSDNPDAKKCVKVTVLPVELSEILFSEQLHDLKLDEVLTDTWTVATHAGD